MGRCKREPIVVINSLNIKITLLLIALLFGSSCIAHELKQTTARVILRDGQVEIRVNTDGHKWQATLANHHAWLMGDINQVISKEDQQYMAKLKELITSQTSLLINGKPIATQLRKIPSKINIHDFSFVLQAQHSSSSVSDVSVTLPKSLGAVLYNFVHPQYQMSKPGQATSAHFSQ